MTAERCPTCDRPPLTDAQRGACYSDVPGSFSACRNCLTAGCAHHPPGCDRGPDCDASRVDWRARALSAEGQLSGAVMRALNAESDADKAFRLLDPRLVDLDIASGTMKVDGQGMARIVAASFWQLIAENPAPNYLSITLGADDDERQLELVIRKRDGKTPQQMREKAEAERDRLRAFVEKVADFRFETPATIQAAISTIQGFRSMASLVLRGEDS